jgi:hypothetical protein
MASLPNARTELINSAKSIALVRAVDRPTMADSSESTSAVRTFGVIPSMNLRGVTAVRSVSGQNISFVTLPSK